MTRIRPQGYWTEERVAELKMLMAKYPFISSAEIASHLGCTRNAVIGICHRKGIQLMGKGGKNSTSRKGTSVPARRAQISNNNGKLLNPRPLPREYKSNIAAGAPETSFVNAGGGCMWPDGEPGKDDFRYCDDMVVAGSYCAYHHSVAHVKTDPDYIPIVRKTWRPSR